jgi:hypothetical protein
MRIELHYDITLEARLYDNDDRLRSVIPQHDIIGLPDLTKLPFLAFQHYLSHCHTRMSRTSDGSYLLRLQPKLKGGGGWDFIVSAAMVASGTALTVFTGGLASVPGAALAGGGMKGCIHAYNNPDSNFGDDFYDSVIVGGVTGMVTGGVGVLGPAAGSLASGLTGFTQIATVTNVGMNMAGSVAATAAEAAMEGREVRGVDLLTSAVVGGVASGVQSFQAENIAEAAKKGKEASAALKAAATKLGKKAAAKVSNKAAEELAEKIAKQSFRSCVEEVGSSAVGSIRANAVTAAHMGAAPAAAAASGVVVGGVAGAIDGGRQGAVRGVVKGAAQGAVAGIAVQTHGFVLFNEVCGATLPLSTAIIYNNMKYDTERQRNRDLKNDNAQAQAELNASQANLAQAHRQRDAAVNETKEAKENLQRQEAINRTLETKLESRLEQKPPANPLPLAEQKAEARPAIPSSDISQMTRRRR